MITRAISSIPDPQALSEHLHLAIATGELTPAGAVAFISHLAPTLTPFEARCIFRRGDHHQMACSYDLVTFKPRYGPRLRVWERVEGSEKGIPVIPEIAEKYSPDITWFTDL
ncbi:hypothetical protein GCM10022252_76360 [Streptosporangium oxazolinicum]|uniref:Uncharacterized protein n=1 Tax=Streptosporangium oxazolinicum TaxID=909287 RepID=A0ABP8BLI5_9ACTN